eukprot:4398608-Heterocapsa_arctica.AAC.1
MVDLGDDMRLALRQREPIWIADMSAEHLAKARLLYGILVQVCSGRALSLLRLNTESNGLECWRQLHVEFEPATATRTTAMLSSLLMP